MAARQAVGPVCTSIWTGTPAAVWTVPHCAAGGLTVDGPPCAPGEDLLCVGPQPATALAANTARPNAAAARERMGASFPRTSSCPVATGIGSPTCRVPKAVAARDPDLPKTAGPGGRPPGALDGPRPRDYVTSP